jgi:hypothetical protein
VALLLLFAGAGCDSSRTLSEADCNQVRQQLEEAWRRDAVAAARLAERDDYLEFIREQGRAIGEGWMNTCRAQLGRPVSGSELECLGKAETIDDVYECAR